MRKQTKIWLVIATCLILLGGIMFSVAMSALNWDFKKFDNRVFVTNTHTFSANDFVDITIESNDSRLYFYPSEDDECKIVCYEVENLLHTVEVIDGKLTIRRNDTRKLIQRLSFGGGSPEIEIYLPEKEYGSLLIRKPTGDTTIPKDFFFENIEVVQSTGDVICNASAEKHIKIRTSTGDINIENISAKSLNLSVSTGDITASSVTCDLFDSEGDTGDLILNNVIATAKMRMERSTGDITLNDCDAPELEIETDTGDISGTLLTEKFFDDKIIPGKTSQVPGIGICKISTDTGEVDIKIKE